MIPVRLRWSLTLRRKKAPAFVWSGLLILHIPVSADTKRINGCGSQTVYPFIRYTSVDANVENITSPAPGASASPRERHQRAGEEAEEEGCRRLPRPALRRLKTICDASGVAGKSRQQKREARTLKGIFDLRGLSKLDL